MAGHCDQCVTSNCLCASDNHGIPDPTKIPASGIKDWGYFVYPKEEPREYEKVLEEYEELEKILEDNNWSGDELYTLIRLVKLIVHTRHRVSVFDIASLIRPWCLKNDIKPTMIDDAIETAFSDVEFFDDVKNISRCLGQSKRKVLFGATQLIEAAEWIKGRYHMKRIELTGDLLFFNDKFYQRDADALIRRVGRERVSKPKTKDMTEVVKYIEDTCDIITWQHIESSIHLKCLLNGIYDIKTGIFYSEFNPDYIILNQIPHHYDESKSFSKIDEKVTSIIPDKNSRQSFYDFISSCFHPYTGIDYQFGSVGGTGTGKSQLGKLAEMAVGEENVGDATIHLIAKDQTTQKNMAFKMLNIDYDLNSESIKQLDVIKKWITQDKFTARGIYEQSSSFKPMSRLMFMANDLYEISNPDDAEAIYDRTYIIRVDRKFRHQQEEIKRVMEKTATKDELDGFVTFLLKNATWMYDNESYHHTISSIDVENIWNTFGNRIKMFVDKWFEKGEAYRTESSEPFNKWMSYCIKKGFKAKDKKQFSSIFNEIVGNTPSVTRIDGVECRAYTGFRIKTDEEIADEETIPLIQGENNSKSYKSYVATIPLEILKIYFTKNLIKEEKNA